MGDMDKKTILIKTNKGESEVSGMSGDMKRVLLLIDGKSTFDEVIKRAPPSLRGDLPEIIQRLLDSELIRDKSKVVHAGPKIVAPKVAAPKVVTPNTEPAGEELDFTSMFVAPDPAALAAEAANAKAAQEAEKLKASQEAAKLKAEAEAKAKAEAEAAKLKAEQEAARIKAELEAAKAKALAEERAKQEAEAARIKAEQEAAASAKAEAEARAKEEDAARLKAEQEAAEKAKAEAARIKAEQEAAERAKAEEAARLKAEAEAARIKEEQEAAEKAKAEAEATRLKAEQEAAEKAKAEAARIKAEQEAAEKAKAEAEAVRLKAEQEAVEKAKAEAARIKAEQEAAERAKAEEARIKAEQEAAERAKAEEEARLKAEAEAARIKAAQEAAEKAKAEAEAEADLKEEESKEEAAPVGFQIDLAALSSMDSNTAADELARPAPSEVPQKSPAVETTSKHKDVEAKQDIAAEMARLKAEQEAEILRAKQEAQAQEEEQALAAEQESAWAEAEQRAEQQSKLDAAQAAKEAALEQAKSKQKSTAVRRRNPLPLGKIAAGMFALGIASIFVLPLVWPMQDYLAPLEQRLTERFKQPVKVGNMSAALLPMPKIELGDVKIGAAGELTVSSATLNFDLLSLLSDSKTIKDLELQDMALDGKHLGIVSVWLKGMGDDAQFPLEHVTLRNLKVVTDVMAVPLLQGGADFELGEFSRLVLHSEDEKLNVELKVVANRTQIAFGIRDSVLPLLPSAMFSSFNARGEINENEINISDLDAHAYAGIWSGKGKLNWSRGWKFDASIQAKTMELAELFPQYGLSGDVFVDGELMANAATLSSLAKTLRIDASFEAKRGVINGIDMVETARLATREHLVGGRTNFDELNGSFVAEDGRVRFRSVRITSGMLKASGTFEAAADGQLSGAFNSEIKIRAGNNPLSLSGNLSEPRLQAR